MDDDSMDYIAGALTAHGALLEGIYAWLLAQDPHPIAACQRMAADMLRQFEDLPAHSERPTEGDELFRIIQHGLHRLERFWEAVERRLRSAGFE